MQLRDYQIEGDAAIKRSLAKLPEDRRRVIAVAPTGAGKTWMFVNILKSALEKQSTAWVIAPKRQLVDQAVGKLDEVGIGRDVGVMMANHPRTNYRKSIQVCSRQTIQARIDKHKFRQPNLVIVDEAHIGYDFQKWLMEKFPTTIYLGFTATPVLQSKSRGLGDLYADLIEITNIDHLIREGWLVPPRLYVAPKQADTSNIPIVKGDYNQRVASERVDKKELVGNIVTEYIEHGENRPAIVFAASVKHSHHIVEDFIQAGIPAAHIDAHTKDAERKSILADLENNLIKVVSSVGVFTEGFDLPAVGCVIFARLTASLALYIQMGGRGLRPMNGRAEEGENCIFLDHANLTATHRLVTEVRKWSLKHGVEPEGEKKKYCCPNCEKELSSYPPACPFCGQVLRIEEQEQCEIRFGDNTRLVEYVYTQDRSEEEIAERQQIYSNLESRGYLEGWPAWKVGWEFRRLYGVFPSSSDKKGSPGLIAWRVKPGENDKMEPYWKNDEPASTVYTMGGS